MVFFMNRIGTLFLFVIMFTAGCEKTDFQQKSDLVPITQNTAFLPGVALTFDDNYYDQWIKMLPTLEKYGAKATFYISPNYPSKRKKGDVQKILTLYNAGNEIGSHTMNHPRIHLYLQKHDLVYYYINEVVPTLMLFDSLGIQTKTFAYPYGFNTSGSDTFLEKHFGKIRTVARFNNSANYYYFLNSNAKKIAGLSISTISANSLNLYKTAILKAKNDGSVLILIEHRPVNKVTKKDTFTYAMLDSICHYTVQQNLKFYRMQDL